MCKGAGENFDELLLIVTKSRTMMEDLNSADDERYEGDGEPFVHVNLSTILLSSDYNQIVQ